VGKRESLARELYENREFHLQDQSWELLFERTRERWRDTADEVLAKRTSASQGTDRSPE
jgi:hypothetical protein